MCHVKSDKEKKTEGVLFVSLVNLPSYNVKNQSYFATRANLETLHGIPFRDIYLINDSHFI